MRDGQGPLDPFARLASNRPNSNMFSRHYESQFINCDIRNFPMEVLGKFPVIMADPPWDIHMELPYGTMADEEMRRMNVQCFQDDGVIFLWVTGRAMELGRECLHIWGYEFVQELLWVKTNQLQRIIRTGRTGHWINHSKEHCLIGIKGKPQINNNIDCDVVCAEVRETSRKPDEMYDLLERCVASRTAAAAPHTPAPVRAPAPPAPAGPDACALRLLAWPRAGSRLARESWSSSAVRTTSTRDGRRSGTSSGSRRSPSRGFASGCSTRASSSRTT